MTTNALFFGWNRSIPGREKLSAAHFQEFVHYLSGLQQTGAIDSFDTVFLDLHGGDPCENSSPLCAKSRLP